MLHKKVYSADPHTQSHHTMVWWEIHTANNTWQTHVCRVEWVNTLLYQHLHLSWSDWWYKNLRHLLSHAERIMGSSKAFNLTAFHSCMSRHHFSNYANTASLPYLECRCNGKVAEVDFSPMGKNQLVLKHMDSHSMNLTHEIVGRCPTLSIDHFVIYIAESLW